MNDNTENLPFGYWITAVDRLVRAEFATVFEEEGITRRDWRALNRIDGTVTDGRPVRQDKLRRLLDLGWVQHADGGWELTEAGILAKTRLGAAVDELRARVAGAVTEEEYAAMTAGLQKVAREFGWAEGRRLPRGERRHGERPGHHAHGAPGASVDHGAHHGHGDHGDDRDAVCRREHHRHGDHDHTHHNHHGTHHAHHRKHHDHHRHGAPTAHIHLHMHG